MEVDNGRGWESFKELDRKTLECLKEIIGRNMDVKAILVKAPKEERRATGSREHILGNTYILANRMLLKYEG